MADQNKSSSKESDKFRLPASGYEALCKMIEAYAKVAGKKSAKLDGIAKLAGTNRFTLSSNNGFLSSIGIITGGNQKNITEKGKELGIVLGFDDADKIAKCWRNVAEDSEFFDNILSALRIRRGMTREDLASHVAITAGEPKSSAVLTGARAIIDILQTAKMIYEEDDLIKAKIVDELETITEAEEPSNAQLSKADLAARQKQNSTAVFPMTININIQATEQNVSEVLQQIKRFFEGDSSEETEE